MAHIVLADDDASVRRIIRAMLEAGGHEVTEAQDGAEAVRAYRATPTELVLCDVFMPNKDGIEAILELRREFPEVKIIAISGGGFKGTLDMLPAARDFGAEETLSKPIKQAELLAAVERVLGKAK